MVGQFQLSDSLSPSRQHRCVRFIAIVMTPRYIHMPEIDIDEFHSSTISFSNVERPTDWNSLENNLYSNRWSIYHAKE